jgi:tetratricopeptide (TPR) repeat protein
MAILDSTVDFWEQINNDEYYTDLVMAIEFSDRDRVSLFIAVCDVDLTQSNIIDRYTEQLKPDFRAYQIAVNSKQLNVSRSIAQLVDREPYLQAGGRAVISVIGATSLAAVKIDANADKPDRDTFFGYLQWTRESFRNFHFPIVFWVSKDIYNLMLSETPDFWSWRNGVFFFKADESIATGELIDARLHPQIIVPEKELVYSSATSLPLADLEQLVARTRERNPEDPLLPNLYNRLGILHYNRLQTGEYEDYLTEQNLAIECFQQAVTLNRKYSVEDRPNNDLASSLNNLALLYRSQGKWAAAEPLYDEALAIRRTLFGDRPNNDLATSLNNLASLYESQGKWAAAEPLYEEALTICRTLFGDRPNNDLASSLNNLASLYESQGKWAAAEPLYDEALAIYRTLFGDRPNNDLASSLNNLASLYRSQGKWAAAEPLYDEALAICRTLFGDRPNNDLAISLNNLASLYESQGKWAAAEPLYDEALAIRRTLFGDRPNNGLAISLNNLASLYESQGKWAAAEPLYEEALTICRTLFGDRPNNDLAISLNNLASLYRSQGRYTAAEPLYVRALEMVENIFGTNHPNTQTIRNNLQTLRQEFAPPREENINDNFDANDYQPGFDILDFQGFVDR